MRIEFVKRFLVLLLSSYIFDIPILMKIKMKILGLIFKIGKNSYISYRTILYAPHCNNKRFLKVGTNVSIEHDCDIDYSGGITIEDNVWISERVIIATHEHKILHKKPKNEQTIIYSNLNIGEDSWIGAGAIILGSVKKIGKGSIIGAGAVVRKSVKDYKIVIGNPAQVVGERFEYKEN